MSNPMCDGILKDGVFDVFRSSDGKSVSENYTEWLKTATFSEMKQKENAGLTIAVPVAGLPLQVFGDYSKEDYSKTQQWVDSGKIRDFYAEEFSEVFKKTASEAILQAWLDCVGMNVFGLLFYEDVGNEGQFTVLLRYSPNIEGDLPPTTTQSVVCIGCKCLTPLPVGSKIPYGGITLLFTRTKNSQGVFPDATYVVNTTKGTAEGTVLSAGQPVTPKLRGLRTIRAAGSVASWPTCDASVPEGYKLVGGGGRLNWARKGSLMTASYPASYNTWRVLGKDHGGGAEEPVFADCWAIALYDPEDEFEVIIDSADSTRGSHPSRTLAARDGYQLVGGGARANWNVHGQLLTACNPVGQDAWYGASKDHIEAEQNFLTVYVIAIRPRNGSQNIVVKVREKTVGPAEFPEGKCLAPDGCRLIGGGAIANWQTAGVLLTASYPDGNSWAAKAKSHWVSETATMTIYALGIPEEYFAD